VLAERHLEKTPIGYIQWRFQDGHDREDLAVPDDLSLTCYRRTLGKSNPGVDGRRKAYIGSRLGRARRFQAQSRGRSTSIAVMHAKLSDICAVGYGATKAQEVVPI
jgi:hypothetical protein